MQINLQKPSIKPLKMPHAGKIELNNSINFNAFNNFNVFDEFSDKIFFKGLGADFDREIFIKRKIIKKNQSLNSFFNSIADEIFGENSTFEKEKRKKFALLLKQGKISLSSSAYKDLKNPQSAAALVLDEKKNLIENYWYLDKFIKKGVGIGLNLSGFVNPSDYVKKLNNFFKFRNSASPRPSAGIALLDIYDKDILNFITLKNNAEYKDWCFDLSVIIDDDFLNFVDNDSLITLSNGEKIKAKEIYNALLDSMLKKGEPGVIFSSSKDYLCDSCAAASLKSNENLTLGQINLSKFVKNPAKVSDSQKALKSPDFDFDELKEAAKILNEAMKRLDENSYISILGYCDMLNKMNLKYGSKEAIDLLGKVVDEIQSSKDNSSIKMAISPSGTTSRFLKTSASIEPDEKFGADFASFDYFDEIDTIAVVQNKIKGQISKTIQLRSNAKIDDIDKIIRYSNKKGLKGISVFPSDK